MTEPLRPPKETMTSGRLSSFVARNALWGALLGGCISVAWMVIIQSYWFATYIVLIGAAISSIYGAVSSVPAFLAGRRAAHLAPLVVGITFAGTSAAIQAGLIVLVNAAPGYGLHAAAYSLLGGIAAALTYRGSLLGARRTAWMGAHP